MRYFRNDGTATAPSFVQATGAANPFAAISVGTQIAPALIDADDDGDLDLVLGRINGRTSYYENTGAGGYVLQSGAANPFPTRMTPNMATPTVGDIDGDGDLDLLFQTAIGFWIYENTGPGGVRVTIGVTPETEIIVGSGSNNNLAGTSDGELIQGLGGDDFLDAGAGDDILEGGDGVDYLRGGTGADAMFGGLGNDTYVVDDAGDLADEAGGDGIDIVKASVSVTLWAGIENLDLLLLGNIDGTGNALNNIINGNAGENHLQGLAGDDTLNGGGRDDILEGGDGADTLDDGSHDDRLYGDAGGDNLTGGLGNDILDGGADGDFLVGGAGNDRLDGGSGADLMQGGAGNDTYVVDNSSDGIIEAANAGTDTVESSLAVYTLGDNLENLVLIGAAVGGVGNEGRNTITSNELRNELYGRGDRDTLLGMGGDDVLTGEEGADILDGGAGADYLLGGLGSDKLTGGTGKDQFVFYVEDVRLSSQGQTTDTDTITDLNFAEGDVIDLNYIDANALTAGVNEAFTLVTKFSKTAGEALVRYVASSDTTFVELDVDGDGKVDFRISVNGDLRGTTGNMWEGSSDANGGWHL